MRSISPKINSSLLLLLFISFLAACATSPQKNTVRYSGVFQEKWWQHYERGVSFASNGLWEKAETDIKAAIRQRKGDQSLARTYGRKFVDYFPHRELGIVFLHQGRFKEAINELTTSLVTEKSQRADSYLTLTIKSIVKQK